MPITDADISVALQQSQGINDADIAAARAMAGDVALATPEELQQLSAQLPSAATNEPGLLELASYKYARPAEASASDFNIGEIATRFGKGFAHGVTDITAGAVRPFAPDISEQMKLLAEEQYGMRTPGIAGTIGQFAGSAALSAPAVVASAAGAPVLGAGLLVAGAGLYGAAGAGNMLERLDAYEKETGRKFTQAQRTFAATAGGVIDAGLEAAGIHFGVNRIIASMAPKTVGAFAEALIHGNTGFVVGMLRSAAIEAGEEISEEVAADVTARLTGVKNAFEGAEQRYAMAGVGGAVGGAFLAGLGGGVQRLRPSTTQPAPQIPPTTTPSNAVTAALQTVTKANKPVKVAAPAKVPAVRPAKAAKPVKLAPATMSLEQLHDALVVDYGFAPEQIQAREDVVVNQPDAETARALFTKPRKTKRQRMLDIYSLKYIDGHPFAPKAATETLMQKESRPADFADERTKLLSQHGFGEEELVGYEREIDAKETKDAALNRWSGKVKSPAQRALQQYMLGYIEAKNLPQMEEGEDYWVGGVRAKHPESPTKAPEAPKPPTEAALPAPTEFLAKLPQRSPKKEGVLAPVTIARAIIAQGGMHPRALGDQTVEQWAAARGVSAEEVFAHIEDLQQRGILDNQGHVIEQLSQAPAADEATAHLNEMLAKGHSELAGKGSQAEARMTAADEAATKLHEAGFGYETIHQHYEKFLHGKHYVDNPKLIETYTQLLIRNKAKVDAKKRKLPELLARIRAKQEGTTASQAEAQSQEAATIPTEILPVQPAEVPRGISVHGKESALAETLVSHAESTDDAAMLEQLIREQAADNTNVVTSTFDAEMDTAEQQTFRERRVRRKGRRREAPERGLSDEDIADALTDYQTKRELPSPEELAVKAQQRYGQVPVDTVGFILPSGRTIPHAAPHPTMANYLLNTNSFNALDTLLANYNWIRVDEHLRLIELEHPPTAEQLTGIRSMLSKFKEISKAAPVMFSLKSEKAPYGFDLTAADADKAIKRIMNYYKYGATKSELAQFHEDAQGRAALQPPLDARRETSLVHDLVTPLFKSGLIHGVEMVKGPIINPQTGQEANAVIFHFPDGRSVLRLDRYIELNTIGHEGGHSLIRRLGTDHPYVASLIRLFGNDVEAALDALGDIYHNRVTLPEAFYRRVVRWMRGLWTQAELTLGRQGLQQAILDGLVDYMTRDKAVRPIDQVRADWQRTFTRREREFQATQPPHTRPDMADFGEDPLRQEGEKKLLDFLDGKGRAFYRATLKALENKERPPWGANAPRKEAEKYMNASSMSRIVAMALRKQALTPAEVHALDVYTQYALQEIQRAADSTANADVKDGLRELAEPFVKAYEMAGTMAGQTLEIRKHNEELRPVTMAEWILKTEAQLQRKLSDIEKKRLYGSKVDWHDPVAAAIEMQKHAKVSANELFKWFIATNWLSGTAIPTNFVLNLSKLMYFNTEALISAGINEAVNAVTFGAVSRQRMLNELGPRLRAQYAGLKRGAGAAWKELMNQQVDPDSRVYLELGLDTISVWKKIARQTKSPVVRAVARAIDFGPGIFLRAMSAGDIMVRGAYYMDSMAQQCLAEARAADLYQGTAAFEAFVRSWKEGPEHKALAKAAAANGVFMGPAGKVLSGIKSVRDGLGPVGTYLMPFMHTIGKVMEYGYNHMPVLPLATRTFMHGTPAMEGETWSDVAARQIFGATLLAALMAWMDKDKDHFVGALPDSLSERDTFWRRGVAPWSIGSPEYGYLSIDRDPHFLFLKTAMLAKQAIDKAQLDPNAFKTSVDVFAWAANKAMNELLRDSMFGGIMQPLSGPSSTGKFFQDIPANMVPLKGMFHAASRMYEAAAYGMVHVKDRDGWINKIEPDPLRQTVAHMFGQTGDLPDRLTVWGEPMVVETSLLNEWLPYKAWQPSREPLELELHRLAGVEPTFQYPGFPSRTVKIGQKEIELPDELYRQHVLWSGSLLKQFYQKAMATQLYQNPRTKDPIRTLILRRVDARIGEAALRKIKSEIVLHHRELLEAAGIALVDR